MKSDPTCSLKTEDDDLESGVDDPHSNFPSIEDLDPAISLGLKTEPFDEEEVSIPVILS